MLTWLTNRMYGRTIKDEGPPETRSLPARLTVKIIENFLEIEAGMIKYHTGGDEEIKG